MRSEPLHPGTCTQKKIINLTPEQTPKQIRDFTSWDIHLQTAYITWDKYQQPARVLVSRDIYAQPDHTNTLDEHKQIRYPHSMISTHKRLATSQPKTYMRYRSENSNPAVYTTTHLETSHTGKHTQKQSRVLSNWDILLKREERAHILGLYLKINKRYYIIGCMPSHRWAISHVLKYTEE